MGEFDFVPATELAAGLRAGKYSAREVTESTLQRIADLDKTLHAFMFIDGEGALAAADAADARRAAGEPLGPLHGVPVAIKDYVVVRDWPMERGSLLHQGDVADFDAPAIARLREAGAILVGKTTLPEFGHVAFTYSKLGPPTFNPWSRAHTCGGSSGGSAVAIAAGMVPLAVGTDGGGSIRIPASCCGIVGFKPSLARVPHAPLKNGLDALSHLGPMTRNVPDAALLMSVIAGPHDDDWASLPPESVDYVAEARASVSRSRVAWVPQLDGTAVDPAVLSVCDAALDAFRSAGCAVETLDPVLDDWTGPWRTIFNVMEAAGVAHRMDEVRALSEPSFVELVESGLGFSGVDFMLAAAARREVWAQLAPVFRRFDVLVTPTLTAPPLPVDPETGRADDPNSWSQTWFRHVYQFNMTAQPAMTVSAGLTADGLPVGLQIVGTRYADGTVVRFAAAYEAHSSAKDLRPPEPTT